MPSLLKSTADSSSGEHSLYRDLKLKRRRVQDIVSSECEYISSSGPPSQIDSDRQSVASTFTSVSQQNPREQFGKSNHYSSNIQFPSEPEKRKFNEFITKIKVDGRSQSSVTVPYGMTYVGFPPGMMVQPQQAQLMPGVNFLPMVTTMPNLVGTVPCVSSIPAVYTPINNSVFVNSSAGPYPMMPYAYTSNNNKLISQNFGANREMTIQQQYINREKHPREDYLQSRPIFRRESPKSLPNHDPNFASHYTCPIDAGYESGSPGASPTKHIDNYPSSIGSNSPDIDRYQDSENPTEESLTCAICDDRATGLHYGIITCEGYVLNKYVVLYI